MAGGCIFRADSNEDVRAVLTTTTFSSCRPPAVRTGYSAPEMPYEVQEPLIGRAMGTVGVLHREHRRARGAVSRSTFRLRTRLRSSPTAITPFETGEYVRRARSSRVQHRRCRRTRATCTSLGSGEMRAPTRVTHVYDYLEPRVPAPAPRGDLNGPATTAPRSKGSCITRSTTSRVTRAPVVVQTHGGPASSDRFGFGSWSRYTFRCWRHADTSSFKPNYRGSTGYGDEVLRDMVGHYFRQVAPRRHDRCGSSSSRSGSSTAIAWRRWGGAAAVT